MTGWRGEVRGHVLVDGKPELTVSGTRTGPESQGEGNEQILLLGDDCKKHREKKSSHLWSPEAPGARWGKHGLDWGETFA